MSAPMRAPPRVAMAPMMAEAVPATRPMGIIAAEFRLGITKECATRMGRTPTRYSQNGG